MKVIELVARWLFILCLPVMLLSASIALAINSLWLYDYGFEKYGVSQTTGLSEGELHKAAQALIKYFNSDEEYISLTVVKDGQTFVLFNEREVGHLKDVKGLFRLDYKLCLWTFVYCLIYALAALFWRRGAYRRGLAQGLFGGGALTLGLTLAMGLGILIVGFDRLYWYFHLISFTNDLWQLDPSTDYLIKLITGGFQLDMVVFITSCTAFGALVLGGVGLWYLVRTKRQTS